MGLIIVLIIIVLLTGPAALIANLLMRDRLRDVEEELKGLRRELRGIKPGTVQEPAVEEKRIATQRVEQQAGMPANMQYRPKAEAVIDELLAEKISRPAEQREPVVKTEQTQAVQGQKAEEVVKAVEHKEQEQTAKPIELEKPREPKRAQIPDEIKSAGEKVFKELKDMVPTEKLPFELTVGTRWVAIAGSIAVLIGVIFGLKYLYDNSIIGPLGRTLIVAGWGVAAIGVGQWTRVRGYGIVAKALTALGFALLYAADFAAFGFYHLLGAEAAFGLAIVITAAGLLYAVTVDEVVMAFLSLLGGFLSPFFLSTGENRVHALFGYVLILGLGAMVCAMLRKWRSINVLAFAGTAILYASWYYKFIDGTMRQEALSWLSVFFVIYLVMPVVYELVKRVNAKREDVGLLIANAVFTLVFFGDMLNRDYKSWFAFAAAAMAGAYFAMMAAVQWRSPGDRALKVSLLAIGLFMMTLAAGLYFEMYALAIAWAGEAAVLSVVAAKYRSRLTQAAGVIVMAMAAGQLVSELPMHYGQFRPVLNAEFGSWMFVCAMMFVCCWVYRRAREGELVLEKLVGQVMYCAAVTGLIAAGMMEWNQWTGYAQIKDINAGPKGGMIILAVLMNLYILPRLRAEGVLCYVFNCVAAAVAVWAAIYAIFDGKDLFGAGSKLIANSGFLMFGAIAGGIYASHLIYRYAENRELGAGKAIFAQWFFCAAVTVLVAGLCMNWLKYSGQFEYGRHMGEKGMIVILAGFALVYVIKRFKPGGLVPHWFGIFAMMTAFLYYVVAVKSFYWTAMPSVLNGSVITAVIAAAAMYAMHWLYRRVFDREMEAAGVVAQAMFCMAMVTLIFASGHEWKSRAGMEGDVARGLVWILAAGSVIAIIHGFSPKGFGPAVLSVLCVSVALGIAILKLQDMRDLNFALIFNKGFAAAAGAIAAIAAGGVMLRRRMELSEAARRQVGIIYGLAIIFGLWLLLTKEFYGYWSQRGSSELEGIGLNKAQMWISMMWAVYAAAVLAVGLWRKMVMLRYIGFGFFTLTILKVFIYDMHKLKGLYQIAGFILLGLVLIGVSYLYQYLRKQGFFDSGKSSAAAGGE